MKRNIAAKHITKIFSHYCMQNQTTNENNTNVGEMHEKNVKKLLVSFVHQLFIAHHNIKVM
jgi:hypothetical protein